MNFTRALKTAAAGVVALSLAACGSTATTTPGASNAPVKTTVFKLAFNQTDQHPQYKAAVAMGKALKEKTNGRYSIDVFPNEQLGTQTDVIQNLSNGSVAMMYVGGPVMEGFNKDFIVFNLPYVFDTIEAQNAVFKDQAVMGDLQKSVEGSKKITVLSALFAGVRNVYNSKRPIKTPEDLKGMKIRVQQSDSQVKMITDMGGIASPMGQGEVYAALQSGVLDGAENNETVYDALKHDEVAKYYSYTRHLMIPDYLLMNTDILKGMSAEDQKIFMDLVPVLRDDANKGFIEFVKTSTDNAKKLGAKFNDDVDTAAMKKAVLPLVKDSINNPVRQKLYDAVQAANKANPKK